MPLCEIIRNLKPYERLIIIDPELPGTELAQAVACVEKEGKKYKVFGDGSVRLFDSPVWAGAAAIEKVALPQKAKWKTIDLRR